MVRTGEWLYCHVVNEQPPPPAPDAPVVSGPEMPPASVPPGDLPPGYVWAYQPAPEPEKPWKAPRWLIALSILWAVGLVVSGTIYALHGKPTVREQTTIASSQPTVNQAIRNILAAAGPVPIVAIGGFEKSSGCDITPVRPGVEYTQTVNLFVSPGTESAVLSAIAAGLPTSYAATSGPGNVLDLYADAGNYVGLIGAVPSPGDIEIKAETGCRQVGPAIPATVAPSLSADEMAPIRSVLNPLGVLATSTSAAQIPCAGGSAVMRTVSAQGPAPSKPSSLAVSLATLAGHPTVSTASLVAFRDGTTDVVATSDSGGVTVWATTRCP
jgi:hypothetical protein